jgi:hypothetical protein
MRISLNWRFLPVYLLSTNWMRDCTHWRVTIWETPLLWHKLKRLLTMLCESLETRHNYDSEHLSDG